MRNFFSIIIIFAVLLVGGIAAFYLLGAQGLWLRVLALLALIAAAVGMFFISEQKV